MQHLKCTESQLSSPYSYRPQIEKQLVCSLAPSLISCTHPTKVVRTAASILKLNLLQCSLLGWLLKRSKYCLNDLSSSANHISIFQQDQNKSLLLLILLNAYHVKSFLNKATSPQIDAEVLSLIPQFSRIYNGWRPDSLLKDATLMELNCTFSKWSLPARRVKPDYNKLVNKILELSKTYNVAGNDDQGPKKKRKPNEQQQLRPAQVFQEQPSDQSPKHYMQKSNSMMLRSSRINRNNQNFANIAFDEEDEHNDPVFNSSCIRRSTRIKHRQNYFDLDNSLPPNSEFPQPLNTIFRSSYRIENEGGSAVRSFNFSHLKRTNSNDILKD